MKKSRPFLHTSNDDSYERREAINNYNSILALRREMRELKQLEKESHYAPIAKMTIKNHMNEIRGVLVSIRRKYIAKEFNPLKKDRDKITSFFRIKFNEYRPRAIIATIEFGPPAVERAFYFYFDIRHGYQRKIEQLGFAELDDHFILDCRRLGAGDDGEIWSATVFKPCNGSLDIRVGYIAKRGNFHAFAESPRMANALLQRRIKANISQELSGKAA